MIDNILFQFPIYLYTLPFVLAVLVFSWLFRIISFDKHYSLDWFNKKSYYHPCTSILKSIYSEQFRKHRPSKRGLLLVLTITILLLITMAQPYYRGEQLPTPPEYRDVVFVVDTEVSMLLRDYIVDGQRVDRMTMVKSVLTHLVDRLKGNRMGIILYSENADTLVPLTQDSVLLKTMIKRIEVGATGRMSDPGKALLHSALSLSNVNNTVDSSVMNNNPPILIMLSGVDRPIPEINPIAAAMYLKKIGFSLHVIAIGASSQEAEETDAKTLIYNPANFQLLKKMAESTNGRFYWAKNSESLSDAVAVIQQSNKHSEPYEITYIHKPLYHWPLFLTLCILLLQQIQRRNNGRCE